jgi:hypothetical protein
VTHLLECHQLTEAGGIGFGRIGGGGAANRCPSATGTEERTREASGEGGYPYESHDDLACGNEWDGVVVGA